jgi:hypothetical protein
MRPPEGQMPGTPSPDTISTRRRRIADRAVAARSRANSWLEEPGALIGHARLRGGPGWATTLGYPTTVNSALAIRGEVHSVGRYCPSEFGGV